MTKRQLQKVDAKGRATLRLLEKNRKERIYEGKSSRFTGKQITKMIDGAVKNVGDKPGDKPSGKPSGKP